MNCIHRPNDYGRLSTMELRHEFAKSGFNDSVTSEPYHPLGIRI